MDTGTLGQGPIFGDDPIEDQELDLFSRGDYANRAVEVLHNLSNHQHSTVGSITRRLARAVGPRRPGDVHPGGVPPSPCELASDHGTGL